MTGPEEMQVLVSDLRAAVSGRMQAERERQAEAVEDVRERRAGVAGRRVEVAATVDELHRERRAEAAEDAREREAADDARERRAGMASRRVEVAATQDELHRERAAVRAELLEVGAIWRDHSAAIASLRGRASVSVPEATRAGVPELEAPAEPEEATARESPAEEARPVSAVTALGYLANHPDGVKLTELEASFNTPRIVLARILSEMIADNRVRRDEKTRLYFAA